ncbi:MAG: hypothetical protein E7263_01785 [Lachnospiraceae bacterium]|nr:hypothetical protein [Lachnospiraceae bacterium]
MKKKVSIMLLGMSLMLGLVACGKDDKDNSKSTESKHDKVTTEVAVEEKDENTETDTTEAIGEDTAEATTETVVEEIVDAVPEGPAEANFGPDNVGFYMQGVEFKLPMAYSEFYEKVSAMGWSVLEDGVRKSFDGDHKLYEVEFSRTVEGQEVSEWFDIEVINSEDPSMEVELTNANTQVVSFHIKMNALPKELGNPDAGYEMYNVHSEVYLTKDIGLGRNILNAYDAWGGSMMDNHGYFDWTTGDRSKMGLGSYTEPFIDISSESVNDNNVLYRVLLQEYGECEDVITWISLQNNPFVE